jgi:outer membrane protease
MKIRIRLLFIISTAVILEMSNAQFYFAHKLNYGVISGSTSYEIVASEYLLGYLVSIRSKLDFPLDIKTGGIEYTAYYVWDSKKTIQVDLKLYKELTDPTSKMTDDDWISVPSLGFSSKFSATKSNAELNAFITDLGAYLNYSLSPKIRLVGGLAYRYQKFSYNLYGVQGRQYDILSDTTYYIDAYHHFKVLDYKITYFLPSIKVGGVYDALSNVKLSGNLAYSPLAEAVDEDDHILRGKIIKGKANKGSATIIDLGLHWNITPKIFLNLYYENFSLSLKGKQRQYFYEDDPGTDENEQGLRFTGIKLKINSSYSVYRMSVGFHL